MPSSADDLLLWIIVQYHFHSLDRLVVRKGSILYHVVHSSTQTKYVFLYYVYYIVYKLYCYINIKHYKKTFSNKFKYINNIYSKTFDQEGTLSIIFMGVVVVNKLLVGPFLLVVRFR